MSKQQMNPANTTGSIKYRIIASSFAGTVFSFLLLNIVMLAFDTAAWSFILPDTGVIGDIDRQGLIEAAGSLMRSPKYIALFATEIILLILKVIMGSKSVAHKLEPVEALSNMAMQLNSQSVSFDEERLKAVEDAIDRMDEEGGSLNTGDKELAGLELAVNQLVRRMRDSYMQQARFVSDASHELRTPIAVIKGYADMLDRWGKNDEKILNESVEAIKSESDRMSYLVEQLLFLARGDCGKTALKPEDLDLSEMMKEVFEEYEMIDKDHKYCFKSGGPVPIRGDKTLLKQTARILVDNAVKYTPPGEKITLSTGSLPKADGRAVFFRVQDNGIGMAGQDIAHMFERFYRADDSRTKNTGGTGLGLSIAKWIVDRHGGSFDVLSREDIGTRITVVLPPKCGAVE